MILLYKLTNPVLTLFWTESEQICPLLIFFITPKLLIAFNSNFLLTLCKICSYTFSKNLLLFYCNNGMRFKSKICNLKHNFQKLKKNVFNLKFKLFS